MTTPKMIEVTKKIPKPPEGFQHEKRQPKECEEGFVYKQKAWRLFDCWHQWHTNDNWENEIFAYRLPKPKRLMTPMELAGRWLRFDRSGEVQVEFVGSASDKYIWFKRADRGESVQELHDKGWLYSDTPTSEPKSLEVDCD